MQLVGAYCIASKDLLTQLLEAPMEEPFDLMERGNISATRVQETGPQVAPKAPT
jgi:hypothetical protein